jgi:hypothetical protein
MIKSYLATLPPMSDPEARDEIESDQGLKPS